MAKRRIVRLDPAGARRRRPVSWTGARGSVRALLAWRVVADGWWTDPETAAACPRALYLTEPVRALGRSTVCSGVSPITSMAANTRFATGRLLAMPCGSASAAPCVAALPAGECIRATAWDIEYSVQLSGNTIFYRVRRDLLPRKNLQVFHPIRCDYRSIPSAWRGRSANYTAFDLSKGKRGGPRVRWQGSPSYAPRCIRAGSAASLAGTIARASPSHVVDGDIGRPSGEPAGSLTIGASPGMTGLRSWISITSTRTHPHAFANGAVTVKSLVFKADPRRRMIRASHTPTMTLSLPDLRSRP